MGMVMLPPGVTWEQYNDWLQNTPEGRQYAQYINQASAGTAGGVSHAPPMQAPGAFRPQRVEQVQVPGAFRPQRGGQGGNEDIADLIRDYPDVDPNMLRKNAQVLRWYGWNGTEGQEYYSDEDREKWRQMGVDLREQWRNSQPGRAQPIQPQSQGTPLRPPVAASPAAPGSLPGSGGQPPQQDFGHQYDPWAGATRAPGQPLNRGGPSIGPTKYIGRDGKPMYAR